MIAGIAIASVGTMTMASAMSGGAPLQTFMSLVNSVSNTIFGESNSQITGNRPAGFRAAGAVEEVCVEGDNSSIGLNPILMSDIRNGYNPDVTRLMNSVFAGLTNPGNGRNGGGNGPGNGNGNGGGRGDGAAGRNGGNGGPGDNPGDESNGGEFADLNPAAGGGNDGIPFTQPRLLSGSTPGNGGTDPVGGGDGADPGNPPVRFPDSSGGGPNDPLQLALLPLSQSAEAGPDEQAAAVPEPATWALFGSALLGLAWFRRRPASGDVRA